MVNLNGCENEDTTLVKVHRQLSAPALPDSIEICEGDSLLLTTTTLVAAGGGYSWSGHSSFLLISKNQLFFLLNWQMQECISYSLLTQQVALLWIQQLTLLYMEQRQHQLFIVPIPVFVMAIP